MHAIMSAPRFGVHIVRDSIQQACDSMGLPLSIDQGVFWSHSMQSKMMALIQRGVDWIITFDHDTMLHPDHIKILLYHAKRDDIDALAALQCHRGSEVPLLSRASLHTTDGSNLVKAQTAHFGCTILKAKALERMPLPWMWELPTRDGTWGKIATDQPVHPALTAAYDAMPEGYCSVDPDIWFWHRWQDAGNSLFIDFDVRVGHLEEMVTYYDENGKLQRIYPDKWSQLQSIRDRTEEKVIDNTVVSEACP